MEFIKIQSSIQPESYFSGRVELTGTRKFMVKSDGVNYRVSRSQVESIYRTR